MILHVLSAGEWADAQAAGEYRCASLESEGFIHCCTPEQLPHVLETYCGGRRGLLALHVDAARVRAEVRWEGPGPGGPFPHVYGPLNLDSVVAVQELT